MVTVDLFRLSKHDQMVGHVRILREQAGRFHAIISYRNRDRADSRQGDSDTTSSHRLQADSRDQAIARVLSWADDHFGYRCALLPLKQSQRDTSKLQATHHKPALQ